ncbi:MAG: BhlA/UviB family holin-like peptide [Clostridia bacterium]
MDISSLFKIVAANGVWAVLFLFLLIYELKDSRSREQRYIHTISSLTDRLEVVNDIQDEVKELNGRLNPSFDCTIKKVSTSSKARGN